MLHRTRKSDAQRGKTMQYIEVMAEAELEAEQIAKLFEDEFEGWCPVCKNATVNKEETVCCDCFKQALTYHHDTCGCYP